MDRVADAFPVIGAEAVGHQVARAHGDAVEERDQQEHHGGGGAYGRQIFAAGKPADDGGVGGIVEQLDDAREHQGHREPVDRLEQIRHPGRFIKVTV